MNASLNFTYDINFFDLDGNERNIDNFNSYAPVSSGDVILHHSRELVVDKVIHFVDGQRPSLYCLMPKGLK